MADRTNGRIALVAATVVLIAGLIAAVIHTDPSTPASAAPGTDRRGPSALVPNTASEASAGSAPTSTAARAPAATTPPLAPGQAGQAGQAGQWVTVAQFSGSGPQSTGPMQLKTGQARVAYSMLFTRGDIYIYFIPQGSSPGGIQDRPVVGCGGGCGGTSPATVTPGGYYLHVDSANSPWTITVQEAR